MYLLVSKFHFLEFRLLLSRVAPYLQFVTTNCLIIFIGNPSYIFRVEDSAHNLSSFQIKPNSFKLKNILHLRSRWMKKCHLILNMLLFYNGRQQWYLSHRERKRIGLDMRMWFILTKAHDLEKNKTKLQRTINSIILPSTSKTQATDKICQI